MLLKRDITEVMDTRSFLNMFVFLRVIYRRSCISEEHSNNSCFSMNKKVGGDSSSRTHAVQDVVLVLRPPLYQMSYHSAEGEGLISDL